MVFYHLLQVSNISEPKKSKWRIHIGGAMPTNKQIQERKALEEKLDALLASKSFISVLALQQVAEMPEFNIRRFAFWLRKRGKRLLRDSLEWVRLRDVNLGGLDANRDFVWEQGVHSVYPSFCYRIFNIL